MNGERDFLLDELGDPDAPKGSRLWSLWVSNEIRKVIYDKQRADSSLRGLVHLFKEHQGYQTLGFLSWEDFCQNKLHKPPQEVEEAITDTQKRAVEVVPLNGHGGDRQVHNHELERKTGTGDADYLTARIARDAPEILERMKQGEYRSVRAAAIDAGIVKDRKRFAFYSDDPQAAGRYLAERVDREWFEAMMDAYYKGIEE